MVYTFRIDDISLNTNEQKLIQMIDFLRKFVPGCRIMLAVCPAVSHLSAAESEKVKERPYPSMMKIESDFTAFYRMDLIGIPEWLQDLRRNRHIEIASHGMTHADHRLMSRGAQELSILMSCALLKTNVFVPPFHHWNAKTERVCAQHGIVLVKYDRNWVHLGYHDFDLRFSYFYFHTHDFTFQEFAARFP